jgi:hypothetical protein
LSTASSSPSARFAHATAAYELVNGKRIADDWTQLTSTGDGGPLLAKFAIDERGEEADGRVWTATSPKGLLQTPTCTQWTSTDGGESYAYGGDNSFTAAGWTAFYIQTCTGPLRLYCFEQ